MVLSLRERLLLLPLPLLLPRETLRNSRDPPRSQTYRLPGFLQTIWGHTQLQYLKQAACVWKEQAGHLSSGKVVSASGPEFDRKDSLHSNVDCFVWLPGALNSC